LIRELERQLVFHLFDRTTRQVAMTSHGTELLAIPQTGLRALDAAMSRIEQAAKGRKRGFRWERHLGSRPTEFYQVTNRGRELPAEAAEFSPVPKDVHRQVGRRSGHSLTQPSPAVGKRVRLSRSYSSPIPELDADQPAAVNAAPLRPISHSNKVAK